MTTHEQPERECSREAPDATAKRGHDWGWWATATLHILISDRHTCDSCGVVAAPEHFPEGAS